MESVTTCLKENFDLVMLLVGILGVAISIIAVAVELKKEEKEQTQSMISTHAATQQGASHRHHLL